ncbi:OLC1v1034178C1 [Oldenlandia corymbosa var. corymbosa]|uniref:OLC1v1034178C1 n=1 Tax=Oldenlandia corymbosa var. corymbosa TaxID=529605 RepID=A0AAV1CQ59_OLDCO|nr:OLC1v1034178C1 [Oldenlandia corymbosa var. corymbosa]
MSGPENPIPQPAPESNRIRPAGGTENSWCKAVPGGTGITTLALLISKPPDIQHLQNVLHKLQLTHPILNSKLHYNPTTSAYSYVIAPTPQLQIQQFDLASTSEILHSGINPGNSVSDFHLILEHELNRNTWRDPAPLSDLDLFFASVYNLSSDDKWVVALRLHTSICDRATAVSLLRDVLRLMCAETEESAEKEIDTAAEIRLGIEDYVPSEKGKKAFWARGVDVLGYSLNSFRLSNLGFKDAQSPRSSLVIRLQLNAQHTQQILSGCQSRNIKLSGLLAAAGLLAAHSSKGLPAHHYEKYAVVTLIDCRSTLDPVLTSSDYGFYHSAVLNTHDVNGEEGLWEMARRTHESFTRAKNNNKHFTDIADVNFLMCKAIENPGLTPSSSLRTALISVFEDPVIDHSNEMHERLGLEDYVGCASSHGVGPSLAIFDTIKDDQLDCACVFPSPLHSREQMQELIEEMKRILVEGSNEAE